MDALKISLYQTNASYRNPMSTEIVETYPLPPPSTVLGLISTMIRKPLEIGSINIAISGTFDSLVSDYQWYKKQSIDKPYPIVVYSLHNVMLTLHITSHDKELFDSIQDAFESPTSYLYLGRAEDIIKIESVRIVKITKKSLPKYDSMTVTNPVYIRGVDAKSLDILGIPYQLATFMHPVMVTVGSGSKQTTKMIRSFDWELYYYFEKEISLEPDDDELFSHDGDEFVWWSMQSPNL